MMYVCLVLPASALRASVHSRAVAPALRARRCASPVATEPEPDGEGSSEYTVDWDSAWKKELVSRETGMPQWRPEGREPVPDERLREARVQRSFDDAQDNLAAASKVRTAPDGPMGRSPCAFSDMRVRAGRIGSSGSASSRSSPLPPRSSATNPRRRMSYRCRRILCLPRACVHCARTPRVLFERRRRGPGVCVTMYLWGFMHVVARERVQSWIVQARVGPRRERLRGRSACVYGLVCSRERVAAAYMPLSSSRMRFPLTVVATNTPHPHLNCPLRGLGRPRAACVAVG